MTGFAGDGVHVGFDVWQPIVMTFVIVVAVLTATHRAFIFGCDVELGTLSACEVVIGAFEIFTNFQRTWIVDEMLRIICLKFTQMRGIVQ